MAPPGGRGGESFPLPSGPVTLLGPLSYFSIQAWTINLTEGKRANAKCNICDQCCCQGEEGETDACTSMMLSIDGTDRRMDRWMDTVPLHRRSSLEAGSISKYRHMNYNVTLSADRVRSGLRSSSTSSMDYSLPRSSASGRSHMRVLPPGALCPTTSAPWLILSSSENC